MVGDNCANKFRIEQSLAQKKNLKEWISKQLIFLLIISKVKSFLKGLQDTILGSKTQKKMLLWKKMLKFILKKNFKSKNLTQS